MKSFIHSTFLIVVLFFVSFAHFSCSLAQSEESAEVTVGLSKSQIESLASSSSRTARSADDDESLFLRVSLKGDVNQTKTVSFNEDSDGVFVTFSNLDIGRSVYTEAYAGYSYGSKTEYIYSGKSSEIIIEEGENAANITLKSVYSYKITIDANGGTINGESQSKVYLSDIQSGDFSYSLEREGYNLLGLSLSKNGSATYTSSNYSSFIPLEDTAFYAVWSAKEKESESQTSYTYTIVLDANGGTYSDGNTTKTVGFNDLSEIQNRIEAISEAGYDEEDSAEYVPTKSGYTLMGYSSNKDATDDSELITKSNFTTAYVELISKKTTTLYAVWEEADEIAVSSADEFYRAVSALNAGSTIKLAANIELFSDLTIAKSLTIDGQNKYHINTSGIDVVCTNVLFQNGGNAHIDGSSALTGFGGMLNLDCTNATFSGCSFSNCYAMAGGAINFSAWSAPSATLRITNCTFLKNTCDESGKEDLNASGEYAKIVFGGNNTSDHGTNGIFLQDEVDGNKGKYEGSFA